MGGTITHAGRVPYGPARIDYTLRAYQKALEEWPWVIAVAPWAFRYPAPTRTYQDYYTFVTPEFQPKALYLEAQSYAAGR